MELLRWQAVHEPRYYVDAIRAGSLPAHPQVLDLVLYLEANAWKFEVWRGDSFPPPLDIKKQEPKIAYLRKQWTSAPKVYLQVLAALHRIHIVDVLNHFQKDSYYKALLENNLQALHKSLSLKDGIDIGDLEKCNATRTKEAIRENKIGSRRSRQRALRGSGRRRRSQWLGE